MANRQSAAEPEPNAARETSISATNRTPANPPTQNATSAHQSEIIFFRPTSSTVVVVDNRVESNFGAAKELAGQLFV